MQCYECKASVDCKNLVDYEDYTGETKGGILGLMGKPCDKAEVQLCDDCNKRFKQKKNMAKARAAKKPKGSE